MKKVKMFGLLALLSLAVVFPLLITDSGVTTIVVFTLIFAGSAVSWNVFSGFTGYISLGNTTFFGLGGYTMALACQDWHIEGGYTPFLLLPLAGLVAGVFAIPLGWVALRTRRHTFVVFTIAIFFIFQLLAYNLHSITNGSGGIYLPNPPWSADVFNVPFYYVSLVLLLLAIGIAWWVRSSKYGLSLLAIRDDEERALGLGVRTGRYKLGAYIISAVFAGMAGGMTAYFVGAIFPQYAFDPTYDPTVALMVLLGGAGTLAGPVLGALLLEPLQQYLTIQFGSIAEGLDLVIFGAIFLAVILWLPEGIVPTLRRRWTDLRMARGKAEARSPAAGTTSGREAAVIAKKGEG
jgi:branched-chain amino acid transport system permease protein